MALQIEMIYKADDIVILGNTLYRIMYVYSTAFDKNYKWATALNLTTGTPLVLSLPNSLITDIIIEKVTSLEILIYNVDKKLLSIKVLE
jgi:hypothetical protein